ncbi:hypothetical protein HanXRQr2_Chr04g0186131 [Helianthus annuus]|uniref:Uncharacterized protein n=1 Tax=Helianthus annuus TaxID=4232 RepID=A0A9K3JBH8_HELAN|nr:hypothetical protein HanXRQr2_Chr04g0186131 [Helianthus annuus]
MPSEAPISFQACPFYNSAGPFEAPRADETWKGHQTNGKQQRRASPNHERIR